jgi:Spx/MgsR family transcriptional regulator
MYVLYGIKTCDTCKKARAWLDQHRIDYRFHDFRIDGLSESQVQYFIDKLGWERLLNKSSTSWRQLSPEQQADLTEAKAKALMMATPTLIKRPVLDIGNNLLLGFKPEIYATNLK